MSPLVMSPQVQSFEIYFTERNAVEAIYYGFLSRKCRVSKRQKILDVINQELGIRIMDIDDKLIIKWRFT